MDAHDVDWQALGEPAPSKKASSLDLLSACATGNRDRRDPTRCVRQQRSTAVRSAGATATSSCARVATLSTARSTKTCTGTCT